MKIRVLSVVSAVILVLLGLPATAQADVRSAAAERVLSFGTSGRLYADNLVMYDRQTESLWPQLTGQAALGRLTGTTRRPPRRRG